MGLGIYFSSKPAFLAGSEFPFSPALQESLSFLQKDWERLCEQLPDKVLAEESFQNLNRSFRNALKKDSLASVSESLLQFVGFASSYKELSAFQEEVLNWILKQEVAASIQAQTDQLLRQIQNRPDSIREGVSFLVSDLVRHPVRAELLVGMGMAGLGMRLGRLAGASFSRARAWGNLGQWASQTTLGFGAELVGFSLGTRTAQAFKGERLDWSGRTIGQEMLSGLFLMTPMKLGGRLGHLGRASGSLRLLQAGSAHYLGAAAGTYASAWVQGQSLSSYQIFSGAAHLMMEGALAGSMLRVGFPKLEAAHRALEMKTHQRIHSSLSHAVGRVKALWKNPLNKSLGLQEALAVEADGEVFGDSSTEGNFNGGSGARVLEVSSQQTPKVAEPSKKTPTQEDLRIERINKLVDEIIDQDKVDLYPTLRQLLTEIEGDYPSIYRRVGALLDQYQKENSHLFSKSRTLDYGSGDENAEVFTKPEPRALRLALMEHRGDLIKTAESLGLSEEQLGEIMVEYGRADPFFRHPEKILLPFKLEADLAKFEARHWEWFFTYVEVVHARELRDIFVDYDISTEGIAKLEVHPTDRLPAVEKDRRLRVRRVAPEVYELLMVRGGVENSLFEALEKSPAALQGHLWIPPRPFLVAHRQQYQNLRPESLKWFTEGLLDRMYEEHASKRSTGVEHPQFSFIMRPTDKPNVWTGQVRAWDKERAKQGDIVIRFSRQVHRGEQGQEIPRYSVAEIRAPEGIPVAKYLARSDAALSGGLSVAEVAAQPKPLLLGQRAVLRLVRQAYDINPVSIRALCKKFGFTNTRTAKALLEGRYPTQSSIQFETMLEKLVECLQPQNGEFGRRLLIKWRLGRMPDRFTRQEFRAIFSNPEKLLTHLIRWSAGRFSQTILAESGGELVALTTKFDEGRVHYLDPKIVSAHELPDVLKLIHTKERVSNPFFVFQVSQNENSRPVLGLRHIKGEGTSNVALAWFEGMFSESISKSPVVRAALYRRWHLGTYKKAPTIEQVNEFVMDIKQGGTANIDQILNCFRIIDGIPYSEKSEMILWGFPHGRIVKNIEFSFDKKPEGLSKRVKALYSFQHSDDGVLVKKYISKRKGKGVWEDFSS